MAQEQGITVVLDTTLTDELINEGLLREVVRNAQILRKEADFNIDARVKLNIVSKSENLTKVLKDNADKIKQEVLALEYNESEFVADIEREVEVGDNIKVIISLKTL